MSVRDATWPTGPAAPFRWRDGERLIVFGADALGQLEELLPEPYVLLTTRRAGDTARAVVDRAAVNAIMLFHTLVALARRAPEWNGRLGRALGSDPLELAVRLRGLGGVERLRDVGAEESQVEVCAKRAAERPSST